MNRDGCDVGGKTKNATCVSRYTPARRTIRVLEIRAVFTSGARQKPEIIFIDKSDVCRKNTRHRFVGLFYDGDDRASDRGISRVCCSQIQLFELYVNKHLVEAVTGRRVGKRPARHYALCYTSGP